MAKQKRSCDGCHKRKIQCVISSVGAQCDWCSYHNLPCTFDRVRGRRKRLKSITGAGLKKDIDERIGQIEHALQRYHPLGNHDESPTPSGASAAGSTGTGTGSAPMLNTHVRSSSAHSFGGIFGHVRSPSSPVTLLTPQTCPTPTSAYGGSSVGGSVSFSGGGGSGGSGSGGGGGGANLMSASASQASPVGTTAGSVWSPITGAAPSPPSPPPPTFTYKEPKTQRNVALGQLYSQGQNLGTLCARDGLPSFTYEARQWILSVTGQHPCFKSIDFEDPHSSGAAPGRPGSSYRALTGRRPFELPERWVADTFLSEFLRSDLSHIFPMVDGVLFQQTMETAYEAPCEPPTLRQLNARACVCAFLAFACSHFANLRVTYLVDGDECMNEAKILLLSDTMEDACLETLQTIFMLVLYETYHGRLQSVSMFHSAACRAIFTLSAHTIRVSVPRDREVTRQEREDIQLRNLFWLCYKVDKDIAIRTGQPPLINDDFCDLTLPDGYVEHRFDMPHAAPDDSPSSDGCCRIPRLPGDLRLDMMNSKVFKLLYSMESCQKSDAELLRAIRELDAELEAWRTSIPAIFAPSLVVNRTNSGSNHPDRHVHMSSCMSMLSIELQVQYHYLMTIIHSASGRCTIPSGTGGSEQAFGVQSSLDLSVEASRSTLIFLKASVHKMAGEAFWFFISYPVSALLTLFFNVLRDPLKEQAVHDVELLRSASDLIRRMPMKKVTAYEETYLSKVDGVITELWRLSRCAIEKARAPYMTP